LEKMKEMERWSAANEWKVWWVIEFRGSGVVEWNDEGGPKGVKGGIVQKKCSEGMVHGAPWSVVSVRRVVEDGRGENGGLQFGIAITRRCTKTDCS